MRKTRVLVFMGLLLVIQMILTRPFAVIFIPDVVRIGFSFIPLSLSAMLFGPVMAGLQGVAEDLLGMLLFPQGPYFPGFTLSAFLGGAVYGLMLYGRPKSPVRIFLAVLMVTVFVDLGLNTLWLTILYHRAAVAILGTRLLGAAVMLPVKVVMIYTTWNSVGSYLERHHLLKRA